MDRFPFVSLPIALVILRVGVALCFLAHATVRVVNGSWTQFASFLDGKGLVFGTALVWAITAFEVVGSVLLAVGMRTRLLAAGFFALLAVGIVLIHAANGWFVGEHGTGGIEYSFALMLALVVIAAAGEPQRA